MKTYTIDQLENSIKRVKSFSAIDDSVKRMMEEILKLHKDAKATCLLTYDNLSARLREIFDGDPVQYQAGLEYFFRTSIWGACVPEDMKLPKQGVIFVYGCGTLDQVYEEKPLVMLPGFSFKQWKLIDLFSRPKDIGARELKSFEKSNHHHYIILDRLNRTCATYFHMRAGRKTPPPYVPHGVIFH